MTQIRILVHVHPVSPKQILTEYALKAIKSSNVESERLILEEKTWQDKRLIKMLNKT